MGVAWRRAGVACAFGLGFACGSPFTAATSGDGGPGQDGAGGEGGADVAPPPNDASTDGAKNGETVTGRVVDRFMQPLDMVTVAIGDTMTTTNGNGSFTVQGVEMPYDAIVVTDGAQQHKHGYEFVGLTRSDPTLQLAADSRQTRSGTLSTTVAWNGAASTGITWVDFGATAARAGRTSLQLMASTTAYASMLDWTGASNPQANAYVLEWTTAGATLPAAYTAYAGNQVTLGNMASVTLGSGSTPPTTGTLTPSITPSQGYGVSEVTVYFRAGSDVVGAAIIDDKPPSTPAYAVPSIPSTTLVLCAGETPAPGQNMPPYSTSCLAGLSANAMTSVKLVPPPAFMGAPTANVTTSTPFVWNAWASAVHLVAFTTDASNDPDYFVVTGTGSTRIPDLGMFGLGLPMGGVMYSANVLAISTSAGVDDATGPAGFLSFPQAIEFATGPTTDGQLGGSGAAIFTTN